MTSLDQARQGRSAARQIRNQAQAGVLTARELYRLLDKVDAGFEQMLGMAPFPAANDFDPLRGVRA
ncbi:hypothetical protein [Phenylobacterium sp.]|uniref:hypothetical protein n=1 Tax=Phenylobacterium sp. TaxID=1871053 RepID=UPI002D5C6AA4|nr:hypothetical protein [Caulobacteraceae bacterium]